MGHPIPKDLKGEERLFSIPYLDIHFNKKATAYCLVATVISGIFLRINFYIFMFLFITLNVTAYVLATLTIAQNKFEGGNVSYDVYLWRKFKYKRNKNVYIRRRSE